MAVPGPINSPISAGTNRLIRDGAAPYLEPADLLQHFPDSAPIDHVQAATAAVAALPASLTDAEREVAVLLGAGSAHVDALAERTGKPVSGVLAILSALEIAGVAEQLPGKQFRRA